MLQSRIASNRPDGDDNCSDSELQKFESDANCLSSIVCKHTRYGSS